MSNIINLEINLGNEIGLLCQDIAKKHAEIIERKVKSVCERYNCTAADLILEYHDQSEIKIKIQAANFKIDTVYTVNGMELPDE